MRDFIAVNGNIQIRWSREYKMKNIYDKIGHSKINWEDAMKREMDLCRTILLEVEEKGNPELLMDFQIKNYTLGQIGYHIQLLQQAKLINAKIVLGSSGRNWLIYGLTWDGHEFLDVARNETFWEKAKDTLANKGAPFTLVILKEILENMIRQYLGLK